MGMFQPAMLVYQRVSRKVKATAIQKCQAEVFVPTWILQRRLNRGRWKWWYWKMVVSWWTRWWFQRFFIFIPIWGRFQFWLIFFKWVEATNQWRWYLFFKCIEEWQWYIYIYISWSRWYLFFKCIFIYQYLYIYIYTYTCFFFSGGGGGGAKTQAGSE